ncbi:MAG: hypothetical protein IJF80_06395 [Clostridia bacterium]|nr:hypothetical protein [Clostridia bacterium]
MKGISFMLGMLTGIAVSTAAVTSCYPDISRRMMRDGKRAFMMGKKFFC